MEAGEGTKGVFSYPGHPGAALLPKRDAPCGLQSLEIFVGLEESAHAERVDEAKEE